jgi:uroporphyrinogen-III synthase
MNRPMNSANDLDGMTVLLTRPARQSEGIAAAIEHSGGKVCQLPLIEIEPVSDPDEVEIVKQKILNLDRYNKAIFISTNAAEQGLQWIDRYWPQLPADLEAFAVGPGTAAVLRQLSWPVYCSERGVTSEDLLALPPLKQLQGERIALFRGKGGRELLAETLRQRGADVDYLELYRRRTPDYTTDTVDELIHRDPIDAIVVTSAQILDVLLHLLSDDDEIKTLPVIVPSQRVFEQARSAGFTRVFNAGAANDEAVMAALRQLQNNRSLGMQESNER